MEKIKELFSKLRARVYQLLESIEGSSLFERLVLRYEALETRQQEWLRFLGKVSVLGLMAYFLLNPLLGVYSLRRDLDGLYDLNSAVKQFNAELAQKKQGYLAPQGWIRFETNDVNTFQEALTTYLAQIGVSEDFYDIQNQGESLSVKITELSVRQLTALSFQIDGFFPVAYFSQFQTTVHPSNKELLVFDGVIEFKSELAGQLPQGGERGATLSGANGEDEGGGPPGFEQAPLEGSPTPRPAPRGAGPDLMPPPGAVPGGGVPGSGGDAPPSDFSDNQPPPEFESPPSFPGPDEEGEFVAPELSPPPEFIEGD